MNIPITPYRAENSMLYMPDIRFGLQAVHRLVSDPGALRVYFASQESLA